MRLAFVLDHLDSIKTRKDSSVAIMREAAARGHKLFSMQQGDLVWQRGDTVGFARTLELTGEDLHGRLWYRASEPEEIPLQDVDAVLMSKDPPFDMEYIYSTYLLELDVTRGARDINRAREILDHNEKLAVETVD